MSRIAVVGGGIAGLSAAEALIRRAPSGTEIVVLERHARAGGNIRTEVHDGFLCEWGPNGFLDSVPETLALARRVGLDDRILPSEDAARRRFIFRGGRLHQLPGSPGEFLTSGLLSAWGKLRVLGEPFARRRPPDVDETIYDFARRRIGAEAADILIDSMVSGVFAGDARQLSLRACFPRMWQLETEHGGLFRAMLAIQRRKRREAASGPKGARTKSGDALGAPAGRLTSFKGGMEDFISALTRTLGGRLRLSTPVSHLEALGAGLGGPDRRGGRRYRLYVADGPSIDADAVVFAGPADESARSVGHLAPALARSLQAIPTAPLAVLCLGYDEARVTASRGPLDGFGYLVPRGQGPRILGVLWESSIYAGRAPKGSALLRVMIGGARDHDAVSLPDDELLAIVRHDLHETMRLDVEPRFVRIQRHRRGIPQYTIGHLARLQELDTRLGEHPGIHLAGNSYRGVAINACIADAGPLADRVLAELADKASATRLAG